MPGILLFLLLAFLFGSMVLMLVFGYQSIEQQRAAERRTGPQALEGRRFFANLGTGLAAEQAPTPIPLLVQRLEEHLQREHEGAAVFASAPSREGLLSGYPAYVDAVAQELERHIQHECASAATFVDEPSFEGLFKSPGPQPIPASGTARQSVRAVHA